MSHHCHVPGCSVEVPPKMLMCRKHWFSVPQFLRTRVWAAYRPGQEDDKDPSAEWIIAADAAIAAVVAKQVAVKS